MAGANTATSRCCGTWVVTVLEELLDVRLAVVVTLEGSNWGLGCNGATPFPTALPEIAGAIKGRMLPLDVYVGSPVSLFGMLFTILVIVSVKVAGTPAWL